VNNSWVATSLIVLTTRSSGMRPRESTLANFKIFLRYSRSSLRCRTDARSSLIFSPRCRCIRLPGALHPPPVAIDRCPSPPLSLPVAGAAIRLGNIERTSSSTIPPSHHCSGNPCPDHLFDAFRMHFIMPRRLLAIKVSYRNASLNYGLDYRAGRRGLRYAWSQRRCAVAMSTAFSACKPEAVRPSFSLLISASPSPAFPIFMDVFFLPSVMRSNAARLWLRFLLLREPFQSTPLTSRPCPGTIDFIAPWLPGRRIHANRLAFDQAGLRQTLQDPTEDVLMCSPSTNLRWREMVRDPVSSHPVRWRELPEREQSASARHARSLSSPSKKPIIMMRNTGRGSDGRPTL